MTETSRELGIRRPMTYRWISEGELDPDLEEVRYGPRPPVPAKLDPYKAIVRERFQGPADGLAQNRSPPSTRAACRDRRGENRFSADPYVTRGRWFADNVHAPHWRNLLES